MNGAKGGSFSVETAASLWLSHPIDPSVDVAIPPYAPQSGLVEYKRFPYKSFVDAELIKTENVGVGDDLFLTGLFVNHFGQHRILPLVRVGNIALMPEEPIQTKSGPKEGYLFEARSIGGLSGSPVFLHLSDTRITEREGVRRWRNLISFHLLGLVHGHWDVPDEKRDNASENTIQNERLNVGIAIVVPAAR
jgi:hypothetical protein